MACRIQQIAFFLAVLTISQAEYCSATYTPSEETLKKYKEESQELAKNLSSSKIAPIFENDLDSSKSSELKNSIPFYQGENVANAGIDIERASDQGAVKRNTGKDASKSQCNAKNCELGNIFSSSAMMDREVKMDEAGFQKDAEGNIIDNKGYLDQAKKISNNAASNFDFLKGEYKNCQAEDSYTTAKTVESCDQYYDVVHNNCPVNQVVEIDPRYLYQCHKKREVKEKVCNEYVTSKCETMVPCSFSSDGGGLYSSSSNRDFASSSGGKFKWNYNSGNGELAFGNESSYSYKASGESCETKEFTATFFIKDKARVSEFALSEVFENNLMEIWVNGHYVYNGELYGTRPRSECYGGTSPYSCWLNACNEHWRSHYYDLKGIIREGWNDVRVKLRYTRAGHAGLRIKARQYCCDSWNDKSEVKCEYVK